MIGGYEVLGRIGEGGMAEVLLARVRGAAGFARLVVIKRLLPEIAASPANLEMFMEEARTLAGLDHPNIVQVIDLRTDDGAYMVLEHLRGQDVRSIMRRCAHRDRKLPLEHALSIVTGVCAGLRHTHSRGVIHRDVSPHNVFVTYDGEIKLLDFGIAKTPTQRDLTRTGTLKGKLGYMSPEQCRGEKLGPASDLFSLGIMLYELTCGRRLFDGSSDYEVLRATIEDNAPSPRRTDPDYPPALEAVVLRALARRPDARFPSALAMLDALDAVIRDRGDGGGGRAFGAWIRELFPGEIEAWQRAEADPDHPETATSLLALFAEARRAPEPLVPTGRDTPTVTGLKGSGKRRWSSPMIAATLVAIVALVGVVASAAWRRTRADSSIDARPHGQRPALATEDPLGTARALALPPDARGSDPSDAAPQPRDASTADARRRTDGARDGLRDGLRDRRRAQPPDASSSELVTVPDAARSDALAPDAGSPVDAMSRDALVMPSVPGPNELP